MLVWGEKKIKTGNLTAILITQETARRMILYISVRIKI